nr:hypothetical protein [uncultured Blautia sp.]
MPNKIEWDKTGERLFETGIDHGVLYPQAAGGTYPKGVAWNGLTAVTESPSGAEPTPLYADNIKYLNLMSVEEFGFTIEAYMYPDEFAECNGEGSLVQGVTIGQQKRKAFGMSYRTLIGNDVDGDSHGYKLHLIYGALAAPSEMARNTVNDNPEAATMSWECSTTPVTVDKFKPTSHIIIDSTKVDPTKLAALEKKLYGDNVAEAALPLPNEVAEIMKTE